MRLVSGVTVFYKYLRFLLGYLRFLSLARQSDRGFSLRVRDWWPCLHDATQKTGFDRHYVRHTAWAARQVARIRPSVHVDFGSSLYFCSMLSAFVPVEFYDYRPAALFLSGLKSGHADLTQLDFASDSFESVSCMHVLEHIGLGRYGDPVDYDGDLKAIRELRRIVRRNGYLTIVVPIGKARIAYNAHRIYSFDMLVSLFPEFDLVDWALIPDSGDNQLLIEKAPIELFDRQHYGCGCFCLRKRNLS